MLRHGLQRMGQLTPRISIRMSSNSVSWSTGDKNHPAPPDCPMGNKGEYPYKLEDGGIQYFGFKYYPRYEDEVDPPYEPSPLHLVRATKRLRGIPWYQREILMKFKLDMTNKLAVIKNNPENNASLWRVKHLVKIVPVQLPKDLPENPDPRHLFIKETGEMIYTPNIDLKEEDYKEDPEITRTKWNTEFVCKYVRKNWEMPWELKLC